MRGDDERKQSQPGNCGGGSAREGGERGRKRSVSTVVGKFMCFFSIN